MGQGDWRGDLGGRSGVCAKGGRTTGEAFEGGEGEEEEGEGEEEEEEGEGGGVVRIAACKVRASLRPVEDANPCLSWSPHCESTSQGHVSVCLAALAPMCQIPCVCVSLPGSSQRSVCPRGVSASHVTPVAS